MEKRDIRLDLIRSFATLGVVTLHLVGAINTLQLNQGNKFVIRILLAIVYCSVNLFGILSGYLKIDRSHHSASLLKIILQTAFWCFLITIVCVAFLKQRSIGVIVNNAFPLIGDRLWYITCYCFVFLCVPYLNLLANKMTQSNYEKLLIIFAVLMSVVSAIFFMKDIFHIVNSGYSAGWLSYMYLLGGYYKKYGFGNKMTKNKTFLLLLMCVCIVVISKYALEFLLVKVGMNIDKSWIFYYYCSPLTLLISICFFYLFVNASFKNEIATKGIIWLSKMSFGIYIIHAHPYSLDNVLIGKNLTWIVKDNPLLTLFIILACTLGIAICAGGLEYLRSILFKVCGIDRWIKKMGKILDKKFGIEKID